MGEVRKPDNEKWYRYGPVEDKQDCKVCSWSGYDSVISGETIEPGNFDFTLRDNGKYVQKGEIEGIGLELIIFRKRK